MSEKAERRKAAKAAAAAKSAPLAVFAGFIPEAARKDALEFAAGIAAKHCASPENSYFGITAWKGGFAYEVHEGGPGKALLPSILAEFDRTEEAPDIEPVKQAYIHAGMRTAKISRTANGVASVLLPEDQQHAQSDFVHPGKNLTPWLPRKRNMLYSGAAVLFVGVVTMVVGNNARLQYYDDAKPAEKGEKVALTDYPISQMTQMADFAQQGKLVTGLSMAFGKWTVTSEDLPKASVPAAVPAQLSPKGGR